MRALDADHRPPVVLPALDDLDRVIAAWAAALKPSDEGDAAAPLITEEDKC